jgi:iron complex outermembrane receptor protein
MNSNRLAGIILFLLGTISGYSQVLSDSLQPVEINAYFEKQPLMRSASSISVIDGRKFSEWSDYSLVPALNSAPGVRMEERSPGSYRLSVRGSLLRSPFGVRNIKIYLADFPLTDAGGNTYLNMLDPAAVQRMEILKGPEASIFGANSGGVVLIDPVAGRSDTSFATAGISAGSYGTFHEKLSVQQAFGKYRLNITHGFQRSDGYRENSASGRHYLQLFQQLNYIPKARIKVLMVYSDLAYRTPGGLTLAQFEADPRAARYPTPAFSGAADQKAGITNRTLFGGISHDIGLTKNIRHHIAVFGSQTAFENPFITNYETRNETSAGARTFIELSNNAASRLGLKWNTGIEAQQTASRINNYDNNRGIRDSIRASDRLIALQYFYFMRVQLRLFSRLTAEAALSINHYSYRFRNELSQPYPSYESNTFHPQLMPRFAIAYEASSLLTVRASASRGYSVPTIAEIRPSDNLIYRDLQAENGWNYETGIRIQDGRNSLFADVVVFCYRLDDAIVRRMNETGTEYFVNAGGTRQWGLETQLSAWIIRPRVYSVIRSMQLWNSYTFSNFLFRNYRDASADYSGKRLTGVPAHVNVCGSTVQLPQNTYLHAQYNYTARIPLNDLNSAYANAYHLVQLKGGWKVPLKRSLIEFFAGIDNLLNVSYSLGNDLNAAGNRYYNPAPLRNYFGGATFSF